MYAVVLHAMEGSIAAWTTLTIQEGAVRSRDHASDPQDVRSGSSDLLSRGRAAVLTEQGAGLSKWPLGGSSVLQATEQVLAAEGL
jgi:hypothetical protein